MMQIDSANRNPDMRKAVHRHVLENGGVVGEYAINMHAGKLRYANGQEESLRKVLAADNMSQKENPAKPFAAASPKHTFKDI